MLPRLAANLGYPIPDSVDRPSWNRGACRESSHGWTESKYIVVVPTNGLAMEPCSIKPVSRSAVVATCPFFMRGSDIEITMIAGMDLVGILGVVLVVLVVNPTKAR